MRCRWQGSFPLHRRRLVSHELQKYFDSYKQAKLQHSWAKERALVAWTRNPPVARGRHEVGFMQPRAHSLAQIWTRLSKYPICIFIHSYGRDSWLANNKWFAGQPQSIVNTLLRSQWFCAPQLELALSLRVTFSIQNVYNVFFTWRESKYEGKCQSRVQFRRGSNFNTRRGPSRKLIPSQLSNDTDPHAPSTELD